MYKTVRKLGFVLVFLMLFVLTSAQVFAGRLFFAPASGTDFFAGCDVGVNIMLDTEGEDSTATDAHVFFNPAQIDIVEIRPGNIYDFYPGKIVSGGKISITGASIGTSYKTTGSAGVFATIVIKSKAGVSSTSLNFDFTPGSTIDSNISDITGTIDHLSSVGNANYTFTDYGYCGADTKAPWVEARVPDEGAVGVAPDAMIAFDIADDKAGVDIDTVEVSFDGEIYQKTDSEFSFTGNPLKYRVSITPRKEFLADTPVFVHVEGQDFAFNTGSDDYSFNHPVADIKAPWVANRVPSAGMTGVALDSNITFHLWDDISGIDSTTVVATVEGVEYREGDAQMTITKHDPLHYTIVIDPDDDFIADAPVSVSVFAKDKRGNEGTDAWSFNHPLADNQPPYVQNLYPSNSARQVPLDANITFNLLDTVSGVDIDTVKITLRSADDAYEQVFFDDDFGDLNGDRNNYSIVIDPAVNFPANTEMVLIVEATDFRGNKGNYTYRFNKPAVCGDNIVEPEFGEQCEPPGLDCCNEDCLIVMCGLPEEPECGNLIVEEGEDCEPPNTQFCDSQCRFILDVDERFEQYDLFGGFIGLDNEEQSIMRDMLKDSDGDGIPDIVELELGTDPYSRDTDRDGISDLDEILNYGTDPLSPDEGIVFNTRIVSPADGATTGNQTLFVRGVSFPENKVSVFATSLEGREYALGEAFTSIDGIWFLVSEEQLPFGEYLLQAKSFEPEGEFFDESDTVEILIDQKYSLEAPKIRAINNVLFEEGKLPRIDDAQPMVTGSSEAGAHVFAIFESTISTSTIIADSMSGFYAVFAPVALDLGMHKVSVYAVDKEGVMSALAVENFEVVEAVGLFESIPWWYWLASIGVVAVIALAYLLYRRKEREKEIKRQKELEKSLLSEGGVGSGLKKDEGIQLERMFEKDANGEKDLSVKKDEDPK